MQNVNLQREESMIIDFIKRKKLKQSMEEKNIEMLMGSCKSSSDDLLVEYDYIMSLMTKLRPIIEKKLVSPGIKSNNMESTTNNDVVEDLYKELDIMKSKLDLSIPRITIIYIILASMSLSFFLTAFIVMLIKRIYIIHPFICITSIIGSLGLVFTSVVSIKDWRKFIKDE